jgi:hypothetical protein
MPLKNRRDEYEWPQTKLTDLQLVPEKREYPLDEKVKLNFGFRIVGGIREAFSPDVWTVAWEDFDKLQRLRIRTSVGKPRGAGLVKKLAVTPKQVRKGKFYWSRDPDLPYRIWAMIVHEEGGAPLIPLNVDDARAKMFDIVKRFEFPASALGPGKHRLIGTAEVKWGRQSFIEKGEASGKSKEVTISIG